LGSFGGGGECGGEKGGGGGLRGTSPWGFQK